MRRLAAMLVIGACGQPTVTMRDASSDATIDAALGPWSAPMPLAELDSPELDTDPTISGDGLDIVFSSNRPGGRGATDLYRARRASISEPFGAPVAIAELNTPASDQATELAGDGLTIYLRQMGATSLDIFTARRATRTAMFETIVYEPQLSTAETETNPAISRDGLTFSITREGAPDRELYLLERENTGAAWGAPRQLAELSTAADESGAAFGQNGLVIVFQSDRVTTGTFDLYVATRASKSEPFGPAARIAELDTGGSETDPSLTADLRYIVFECGGDLCYATR